MGIKFIVDSSFLLTLKRYATSVQLLSFQIINPLSFECVFHISNMLFLSGCFKAFFFFFSSLVFRGLILICLDIDFFKFVLLGVCSAFWIYNFMSLTKFGNFHLLFNWILSQPHFFSLLLLRLQWYECWIFHYCPNIPKSWFLFFFLIYFLSVVWIE